MVLVFCSDPLSQTMLFERCRIILSNFREQVSIEIIDNDSHFSSNKTPSTQLSPRLSNKHKHSSIQFSCMNKWQHIMYIVELGARLQQIRLSPYLDAAAKSCFMFDATIYSAIFHVIIYTRWQDGLDFELFAYKYVIAALTTAQLRCNCRLSIIEISRTIFKCLFLAFIRSQLKQDLVWSGTLIILFGTVVCHSRCLVIMK